MKRFALGTLLALAALPAAALVPRADEVELLVEMPLAVTTVADFGVPAPDVERVVVQLNEAEVPVVDTVEIVRYTPFPLVLTEYRTVEPLAFEPEVDWELDELDMLVLLQSHLDDGLRGELLGEAVLADLLQLGFDVGSGDTWRAAPRPVESDFVYYLTPGYRFDTDRGLFRDRVVVVDEADFGFRRDGDRWLPDPDRYRDRDRDVVVRRDGRDVRDDRDARAGGPPAVPPGHAKHGPGGPHPTPGHVKHAGPDGPPGHARDGDRPRARRNDEGPGRGNRGAAKARGNERGGPPAKAGKPDKGGGGGKAKGNQGQGKGQGKGKDKGGGNGRG